MQSIDVMVNPVYSGLKVAKVGGAIGWTSAVYFGFFCEVSQSKYQLCYNAASLSTPSHVISKSISTTDTQAAALPFCLGIADEV